MIKCYCHYHIVSVIMTEKKRFATIIIKRIKTSSHMVNFFKSSERHHQNQNCYHRWASWHLQESRQRTSFCLSVLKMAHNSTSMRQFLYRRMSISCFQKSKSLVKKTSWPSWDKRSSSRRWLYPVQTTKHHCCKDVPESFGVACSWSSTSRNYFNGRYLWCHRYSGYSLSPWPYHN